MMLGRLSSTVRVGTLFVGGSRGFERHRGQLDEGVLDRGVRLYPDADGEEYVVLVRSIDAAALRDGSPVLVEGVVRAAPVQSDGKTGRAMYIAAWRVLCRPARRARRVRAS